MFILSGSERNSCFFFLKFEFDILSIKKFAMKKGYIFIYNSFKEIKEKLLIKLFDWLKLLI